MWFLEWRLSHSPSDPTDEMVLWCVPSLSGASEWVYWQRKCIDQQASIGCLFVLFYLFPQDIWKQQQIPEKNGMTATVKWTAYDVQCFKHIDIYTSIGLKLKKESQHNATNGSGNAEKRRNIVDRRVYQLKNKSTHRSAIVLFPGRLVYLFYAI